MKLYFSFVKHGIRIGDMAKINGASGEVQLLDQ